MQESALSHHVGPRDPTQVVKYGLKHFYSVGHLAGPHFNITFDSFYKFKL